MYADIIGKNATAFVLANENIPLDSPFFKNIESDNPLESVLYKFSNKVGAIIVYLLIQAMNLSNKTIIDNTKSSKEKDLDVEWWIDDAISFLRRFLLPLFQDLLYSSVADFKSIFDDCANRDGSVDMDKYMSYILKFIFPPLYTLDEKLISDLMDALSKIYPSITAQLEWVRSQIPRLVAKEVSELQYRQHRSDQQKKCKHIWKEPSNKNILKKSLNYILHCPNCHKTKPHI